MPYTLTTSKLLAFVLGTDYSNGPYLVTFPTGITESVLNIFILNDNVLEETETFEVIITSSSRNSNVTSGELGNAEVIIWDNDGESCK